MALRKPPLKSGLWLALAVLLGTVAVLVFLGWVARAQEVTVHPTDYIILVDNSPSVHGAAEHPAGAGRDPRQLRLRYACLLGSYLDMICAQTEGCPEQSGIRLSVILFGGQAHVTRHLTETLRWDESAIYDEIISFTDFYTAFSAAYREFEAAETWSQGRNAVIVLFTDGQSHPRAGDPEADYQAVQSLVREKLRVDEPVRLFIYGVIGIDIFGTNFQPIVSVINEFTGESDFAQISLQPLTDDLRSGLVEMGKKISDVFWFYTPPPRLALRQDYTVSVPRKPVFSRFEEVPLFLCFPGDPVLTATVAVQHQTGAFTGTALPIGGNNCVATFLPAGWIISGTYTTTGEVVVSTPVITGTQNVPRILWARTFWLPVVEPPRLRGLVPAREWAVDQPLTFTLVVSSAAELPGDPRQYLSINVHSPAVGASHVPTGAITPTWLPDLRTLPDGQPLDRAYRVPLPAEALAEPGNLVVQASVDVSRTVSGLTNIHHAMKPEIVTLTRYATLPIIGPVAERILRRFVIPPLGLLALLLALILWYIIATWPYRQLELAVQRARRGKKDVRAVAAYQKAVDTSYYESLERWRKLRTLGALAFQQLLARGQYKRAILYKTAFYLARGDDVSRQIVALGMAWRWRDKPTFFIQESRRFLRESPPDFFLFAGLAPLAWVEQEFTAPGQKWLAKATHGAKEAALVLMPWLRGRPVTMQAVEDGLDPDRPENLARVESPYERAVRLARAADPAVERYPGHRWLQQIRRHMVETLQGPRGSLQIPRDRRYLWESELPAFLADRAGPTAALSLIYYEMETGLDHRPYPAAQTDLPSLAELLDDAVKVLTHLAQDPVFGEQWRGLRATFMALHELAAGAVEGIKVDGLLNQASQSMPGASIPPPTRQDIEEQPGHGSTMVEFLERALKAFQQRDRRELSRLRSEARFLEPPVREVLRAILRRWEREW